MPQNSYYVTSVHPHQKDLYMREKLGKLEVAKRQLREAIWLFFHERDAISIHTLVAAAHQILDDLAKSKGIESIRRISIIPSEKQKFWIDTLNEAQNFFKHADKHPEATLDFNPELQYFFIRDAIQLYANLTAYSPFPEAILYCFWFSKKYPEEVTKTTPTEEERIVDMFKQSIFQGGFDPDNFEMMRLLLYGLQTQE
jgi:hypothetical protein